MRLKLGRNDLCWCGSGEKYKYCHLRREREEPVTYQERIKELRKIWSKEYCLHPQAGPSNCQGGLIQAHTIQRSGGLTRIAQDGKVYTFPPDYSMLVRTSGKLEVRLIGVRKASTFTGFCEYHDNATFAPIEKSPFRFTREQIFLLAYRAICRDLFAKRAQMEAIPFLRIQDRGKDLTDQMAIQSVVDIFGSGVKAGLEDIEHHKGLHDEVLIGKDFSNVQYYAVKLKDVPDIMCSGTALFELDFHGNRLQGFDQMDSRLDCFTLSLIGTDDGGAIVFSWLGGSAAGTAFARSLKALTDDEIPRAIVRLTFEFFENASFSPKWWDGLTDKARESIQVRVTSAADPTAQRRLDCLKDDGLRFVNWEVSKRMTNLLL
jgi:hypothetical protein